MIKDKLLLGTRILSILVLLAILFLSFAPVSGPDFPDSDKWGHLFAYMVLSLLLCLGFVPRGRRPAMLGAIALVWLVSTLLGAAVELLQPLTGRYRDILDLAANATGGAIGSTLGWIILARTGRKRSDATPLS